MLGIALPGEMTPAARDFELCQENEAAFLFFMGLQNYWVIGMAGVTGLDHAGVIAKIAAKHPGDAALQDWLIDAVEALETGCLQAWADLRIEADDRLEGKARKPMTQKQRADMAGRRARRC